MLAAIGSGARGRLDRSLTLRPLTWLGKYSYAIYVFHVPLHVVLRERFVAAVNTGGTAQRLAQVIGYELAIMAMSIAGALISWHVLEKRMLALKRYFP